MARRKLSYAEGDWVAVPLRSGGYAVGLVARADGRGGAVGYFFGPRLKTPPSPGSLDRLRPGDAILIEIFGDLGLMEGEWPVIGPHSKWIREHWPLPAFGRIDEFAGTALRIEYDEVTLEEVGNKPISVQEASQLPRDGLAGSGDVEIRLTKMIDCQEQSSPSE